MNAQIGNLKSVLSQLYGDGDQVLLEQLERYRRLDHDFLQRFGDKKRYYFSTPGRVEISGNHTDHNHGRVLTASIDLDSIAVAAPLDQPEITVWSAQYEKPFKVSLAELKPQGEETGTTSALMRGIAARFQQLDYRIGGFEACLTSSVMPGSGLSSSASIEVLLGSILNALYNKNLIRPEEIAKIGQYAENVYFGKPCGLMDQMACAVGGLLLIDFNEPENPDVRKINFDFSQTNYHLLVVDSGASHINLTEDYAAVPLEMRSVAALFGADVLRNVSSADFFARIPELQGKISDRAILRAIHFFEENERVLKQAEALAANDFQGFIKMVGESGDSSFKWLQNIYSVRNPAEQRITLALALTERFISEAGAGAGRIHGGGFAGTILVFLPDGFVENYSKLMVKHFGQNCVTILNVRKRGTTLVKVN
jgi:galactokinase